MANQQQNTPAIPPEVAASLQTILGSMQGPPAAQPQSPQGQDPSTLFAQTPMGSVAMPMNGAGVSMDDLNRVRQAEGNISAGPYGSSPQGEAQTAQQFQQMSQSPYMFPLARTVGAHSPRWGAALDNALLVGSLVKPPMDASGNPVASGAGYGISSALSAMRQAPEARLAYREQLEQTPIAYETAQAQLAQERAKALQSEAMAAHFLGMNQANILAQYGRGQGAEGIRANEAGQANQLTNAARILEQWLKGNTSTTNANIRANAPRRTAGSSKISLTALNGMKSNALAAANKAFPNQKPPSPQDFLSPQDYQSAQSQWNSRNARMADIQQWYSRMADRAKNGQSIVDYSTYANDRTPYGGSNAPGSKPQAAPANGAPPPGAHIRTYNPATGQIE